MLDRVKSIKSLLGVKGLREIGFLTVSLSMGLPLMSKIIWRWTVKSIKSLLGMKGLNSTIAALIQDNDNIYRLSFVKYRLENRDLYMQ